jgi:hypothetical protein
MKEIFHVNGALFTWFTGADTGSIGTSEASTLGFPVGERPPSILVVTSNRTGRVLNFRLTRRHGADALVYTSEGSGHREKHPITIQVFND